MTGSSAAAPLRGERLIRAAAAAAVVAVAGFAAVVSYSHIYDLGRAHGGSGVAARLLPLSVDGLIVAASLVLLHAARAALPAPFLARCMLWLGVAATLAANIAYGARYGAVGAVIWAWPAAAFVGAAEMLMGMIRRGHAAAAPGPETAEDRAKVALQASIVAGNPLSARKLDSQFGIGRAKAAALKAELAEA
jgi:Protein of unknown function (DUF2637)